MRGVAACRPPAGVDHVRQRRVARRPDVEAHAKRRRGDAVEHDAAHAVAMTAHVLERRARAVRPAPQVHPWITERRAHRVEIRDECGGRVLRGVDALCGELARASLRLRFGIELERRVDAVVGLERRAFERRRAAGAALVDEHDVAVLAHVDELHRERTQMRSRLSRPAGEHEQRVGARIERVRRKDGDGDRDRPRRRLAAVLGHLQRPALRRERDVRQAALGERHGSLARAVGAAAGERDGERDEGR